LFSLQDNLSVSLCAFSCISSTVARLPKAMPRNVQRQLWFRLGSVFQVLFNSYIGLRTNHTYGFTWVVTYDVSFIFIKACFKKRNSLPNSCFAACYFSHDSCEVFRMNKRIEFLIFIKLALLNLCPNNLL
jgi:hypothetical protein